MKKLALPLSVLAVILIAIPALLTILPDGRQDSRSAERRYGKTIHETVSGFSHIRIREREGVRSLFFVDKEGREKLQSQIDLIAPHELQLRYSRAMFASLLFRERQERVLIVGLGGGGMVRFLNHALPGTHVDAVEIDPVVVKIAEEFFGTSSGEKTTIFTEDAFIFLREPHGPYDVIYMDAFLRPPAELDVEDKTGRLKTVSFLREMQKRLKPGGIVAFNLIESDATTANDLEAIRAAFSAAWVFAVPETRNLAVIASVEKMNLTEEELMARAASLETKLNTGIAFTEIVERLRPR